MPEPTTLLVILGIAIFAGLHGLSRLLRFLKVRRRRRALQIFATHFGLRPDDHEDDPSSIERKRQFNEAVSSEREPFAIHAMYLDQPFGATLSAFEFTRWRRSLTEGVAISMQVAELSLPRLRVTPAVLALLEKYPAWTMAAQGNNVWLLTTDAASVTALDAIGTEAVPLFTGGGAGQLLRH